MMKGHKVTMVDNFCADKRRHIEHRIDQENFKLIKSLYIKVDQKYHLVRGQYGEEGIISKSV